MANLTGVDPNVPFELHSQQVAMYRHVNLAAVRRYEGQANNPPGTSAGLAALSARPGRHGGGEDRVRRAPRTPTRNDSSPEGS